MKKGIWMGLMLLLASAAGVQLVSAEVDLGTPVSMQSDPVTDPVGTNPDTARKDDEADADEAAAGDPVAQDADAYEQQVRDEIDIMDDRLEQLEDEAGTVSDEDKAALNAYASAKETVDDRLDEIDDKDAATAAAGKAEAENALNALRSAYQAAVDALSRE